MEVAGSAGALAPGGAIVSAASALNRSMGVESMAQMSQAADGLVASAKSGGFTVTKEAADPIIKTLEEFIEKIETLKFDMKVFDQAPQLGEHDYGKKMAQHLHEAANDDKSARFALGSLQDVLRQSREALLRASDQYQEQEESTRDVFRKLGGGG
ncbi:hypothetical protein B1813_16960 [Saccharomonospora piscinae]|uniref:Uncharacterized protein n=2 Tax=Saccharomonospora piscinae TaxID=687388 RepID=A0A1V9A2L7_SACPI|nr:hypothetical protein B1813_16960 [Saccharomonospora piscinae]TLW94001.1 hypothetical protein FFT09_11000 [Saccharomonospora piscinae]